MPAEGGGPGCGAYILCGGASRRMGRDKALLDFGGRPLALDLAARIAGALGTRAKLVGSPDRYGHLGLPVVADLRADCGPLAGIEAALADSDFERNLILACDMPTLSVEIIARLAAVPGDCVVAETPDGRMHPLCAVWPKKLLPLVQDALDRDLRRVLDALREIDIVRLPIDRLVNANTPEEWATFA
ncbi:MAG: molybdenum cofactor guanylyltransferase [Bryobacteraceae bacterium]|nr:molybdenum cofactor guanylyltransferase [Bryobacteraceae bacterium]